MGARVIGLRELNAALAALADNIDDPTIATKLLLPEVQDKTPVLTGRLKRSEYRKENIVGAKAPYAGFVADRPGRDYAQDAIDAFPMGRYAKAVVEPF